MPKVKQCANCHKLLREIIDYRNYIEFLEHDRRKWFGLCQSLARVIVKSKIDPGLIFDEARCKTGEAPYLTRPDMETQRMYSLGDMKVYSIDCFGVEIPETFRDFHREEIGHKFLEGLATHVINGRLKDGFE